MKIIRWGLLSTANINQALIPVIRETARGELAAVASRSKDGADKYARKWKIPFAFGSYQEMLDSGKVDAVYVSLPNHLHAEWSVKALQAGVHVLCEKPFTTSLEDADAMISASKEHNRVLAEAFMYRHHPQTILVKDLIKDGKLGDISVVRGTFNYLMPDNQRKIKNLNVRLVPEYGGGCLWDVGIYPISFIQNVLDGPPEWVFGSQQIGNTGIDEVFIGQMGYKNSANGEILAQISCSFNTPFHTSIEIIGSEGTLYITRPFTNPDRGAKLILTTKKGKSSNLRFPKQSLYLGEVEDLQAAILDETPTLISLVESKNHVLTALTLYQSARSGKVVRLRDYLTGDINQND